MKKKICGIIALCMMVSSVASAARSDQLAELNQLIGSCQIEGVSVDYERAATAVFEQFISTESADLANSKWTNQQKNNYTSGIDKIYNETKASLEGYLDGTKESKGSVPFANVSKRNVSGNIFTDGNGKPLISIGFGHDNTVFTDAGVLQNMGSNNIQTEIGPAHNITYATDVPLWKVLKNGGCDATISVEETDGNSYMKIVNRVETTPNVYVLIRQVVPVKPNTNYLMSLDVKAEGSGTIKFSPNEFNANFTTASANSNWTTKNISGRYTTAADQHYAEFVIISDSASTLYVDNIKFYDIRNPGVNLIKNGDFESESGGYYFEIESLNAKLSAIEEVADKGFSVDLLLSPHYMPEFMLTKYPEISAPNDSLFFQYNINHPIAKRFIADYVEFVIPFVANCDGIQSICLSNEANFYAAEISGFYNPLFREYLKEKHGASIDDLNTAYNLTGTTIWSGNKKYNSWDEVTMPTGVSKKPIFYDYMHFNNELLASWHKDLADIVKKYAPDMPIHSKMQDYLFLGNSYSYNTMKRGVNIELFDEFTDIAGNDASHYTEEPNSFYSTMMWYDMLSSLTGKPVYNSEEHIIPDDSTDSSDAQAQNVRFALINGVVHGRNASTLWRWYNAQNTNNYVIFKQMPYTTYLTSKTLLDVQRLKNEYTAFYSVPKDTAFFYSEASRVMTQKTYENALLEGYKAVSALGHKTGFVTELNPGKVNGYKTLILTDVDYIPESSVDAIANYMKAGGKVFNEGSSLDKNEYGVSKSSDNRTYIKNNAINVSARTAAAYYNAYNSVNNVPVTIKDTSGNIASGIDVKVADYEGEDVIHMVSMDGNAKTIALAGEWTDLLSMTEYTDTVTLTAYEPVLLIATEAIETPDEPEIPGDPSEYGTFSFEGVIDADKASYKVGYELNDGTKTRVVVIAYGEGGEELGFAYTERASSPSVMNSFSGQLLYEGITSLEMIVVDTDTESVLYRTSIQ